MIENNLSLQTEDDFSAHKLYIFSVNFIVISIRVFHINVSWWSFTGVWVTASHLKCSGFNNVVVWMVTTRPPTSKTSSPFSNHLITVPKAQITTGIIVTFMFHSFFNSLARSRHLSFFSHSFSFILWSTGTANSTILQTLFLLIIIRPGLLAEIRWSIYTSKSHRSLCVSFSRTCAGLCLYHLFVWSNLNFLHISQWIT